MSGSISTTVELPGPYDLVQSLSVLRRGPGDPALHVLGSTVWRASRTPAGPVTVRLSPLGPDRVRVDAWGEGASWALAQAPGLLGAFDAPHEFRPSLPWLAALHRHTPGLRLPRTDRVLEALIPAVLEQKVLSVDAFAAWRRLLQRFGQAAPGPGPATLRVPPTAQQWAALSTWQWHQAGVTPQRYRTVQAVARLGERLEGVPAERLGPALRTIPGIGGWTVAETLARVHGDPDAVPWGDYHLGRLVGTAFVGTVIDDEQQIARLLAPLAPHRYRVWRLLTLQTRVERRGPRRSRVDVRHL